MLKIENISVMGWEDAIRGMRNPKNSWARSDSGVCKGGDSGIGCENCCLEGCCGHDFDHSFQIGKNDHELMMQLASAGPVHGKFRRMIIVYMDITAPLYWWKEFDTYKVGTVANSCSTMHKIHAKEFELDDFSHEHLLSPGELLRTIRLLNYYRILYLYGGELSMHDGVEWVDYITGTCVSRVFQPKDKEVWWQMIQLLPTSYNQKRTVMLDYEVLANIHQYRRNHKLDEWHTFCDTIENLPYSEIILASEKQESTLDKTYITDHDRIVMSAYTGILMCDFADYHKFVEETLGRPVLTHELENEEIHKELREKLKPDFLKIIGEPLKK